MLDDGGQGVRLALPGAEYSGAESPGAAHRVRHHFGEQVVGRQRVHGDRGCAAAGESISVSLGEVTILLRIGLRACHTKRQGRMVFAKLVASDLLQKT